MTDFDIFALIVNAASIVLLLLMTALLLSATRFRGANSYAALIIVLTTVPCYLYNICRMQGWFAAAEIIFPLAFAVNTLLMPLLWLFVKYATSYKRSRPVELLHFVPSAALFVAVLFWRYTQTDMAAENEGRITTLSIINLFVLVAQLVVYFVLILNLIKRHRRTLRDNCSDADLLSMNWIERFA